MAGRLVVVAGVPGTGKTVTGSRLARLLGCRFTTLTWLVLEEGLWEAYDPKRRSFIIDYDALVERLGRVEGCLILDTHWLEPLADSGARVEAVILLRTRPLVLAKRLERRGWPKPKIAENVEAEFLGVLAEEARETFLSKTYEIDTSSLCVEGVVREALEAVRRGLSRCCIDWLELLSPRELEETIRLIESWRGAGKRFGEAEEGEG